MMAGWSLWIGTSTAAAAAQELHHRSQASPAGNIQSPKPCYWERRPEHLSGRCAGRNGGGALVPPRHVGRRAASRSAGNGGRRWCGPGFDDALEGGVRNDPDLDETTRRAVIEARRGQGRFRLNVEAVEQRCRISGVSDLRLLKASHIKPWRSCSTTAERLDGNNGLLLCPNVDHLFDRGYISFEDEGRMLISPLVDAAQVALLGVSTAPPLHVGPFNVGQTGYLAFHRDSVFLHGQ